jgi:hypothetical protein
MRTIGGMVSVAIEDGASQKQAAPDGEVPTGAGIPMLKNTPDQASGAGYGEEVACHCCSNFEG